MLTHMRTWIYTCARFAYTYKCIITSMTLYNNPFTAYIIYTGVILILRCQSDLSIYSSIAIQDHFMQGTGRSIYFLVLVEKCSSLFSTSVFEVSSWFSTSWRIPQVIELPSGSTKPRYLVTSFPSSGSLLEMIVNQYQGMCSWGCRMLGYSHGCEPGGWTNPD